MYFLVAGCDIAGQIIISSISGTGSFDETAHRIVASETLYRVGLCCSLGGSLLTVPLAVGLYVVARPVARNLAMMALLFRVIEAATGATGIVMAFTVLRIDVAANHATAFSINQLGALSDLNSGVGTQVSALFFSVGSILFFIALLKSPILPRVLSSWGIFASLVYAVFWAMSLIVPQEAAAVTVVASLPILLAELSTGLWLLVKGGRSTSGNSPTHARA
jgi:hypothetical protein